MPVAAGAVAASRSALPRTPGIAFSGLVAAVAVVVAAVALTARQPPPPSIAELAPQAVEQIKQSLPEQATTGRGGDGPNATVTTTTTAPAPGAAPVTTPTTAEPVEVPKVRRCIGDPPRQTEDPQSPPCVPYFDGDNGGDTSKGVTATEIRVAYPAFGAFFEDASAVQAFVDYVNRRYEFYGRKIVVKSFDPKGGPSSPPNPADMRSDAVKVDTELDAFASLGYVERQGAEHHYYDALAERGVISTNYRAQALATESHYDRYAPYEWNVLPDNDTMMRLYGTFVCNSLAGRPSRYGGADTAAPERKFGLITERTSDGSTPSVGVLRSTLSACGVELAADVEVPAGGSSADGQNAIVAMKSKQVTSVLCLCTIADTRGVIMPAATNQAYFPEWPLSGYIDHDLDNSFQANAPEQAEHVFGISFRNRFLPKQQMPWFAALKEVDPSKDQEGALYYSAASRYAQITLLAAGIQLAGPNLTPESFQAGLLAAEFPNPGVGGPPQWQARFGFDGHRHTATDDATMFWYSEKDGGTVDPAFPGAVCYVNEGARFDAANWPRDDQPFFQGACR